ncbi:hypothetical protein DPMN_180081 [Dreissena polymorpha]|uniref:Uncharacterized protein n=1 Tax=Dreissena polymorpha TaxID=45954 RepID=A0A9D4IMW9_DREPO|nr:hypothetical protein DPMN_180081 [Dreissena polymorpha]
MMDVAYLVSEKVNKTASFHIKTTGRSVYPQTKLLPPKELHDQSESATDTGGQRCLRIIPSGGKESARAKPRKSGMTTTNQALMYRKRRLNPGRLGEKRVYQPLR